jgi:hypothetical protein
MPEPGNLLLICSLIYRCVNGTRDVTCCHWCTWIFSYEGIIWEVPLRRRRSFVGSVTRLEFMASVWKLYEDSHATPLALIYCLYGQMQNRCCLATELLACLSKAWHLLWNVLRILQNDPQSSTQMDGPRVKCVECTLFSMRELARCFYVSL